MKRNLFGTALIVVGALLLLSAVGLLGYNMLEEHSAGESAQAVLDQIIPAVKTPGKPQHEDLQGSVPQVETPNYILNPQMDLPETEYDGRRYVGVITIPALEVELPVLKGWSRSGAKIAPCRFEGTPYMDDLVICAHNYQSHFGRLNTLKTGDLVQFMDMEGNLFTYQVVSFEILQPNQAELLRSGGWDLTLFTCTIGGQSRFTVRCEKI
jgi:sortase A